MSKFFFTTADDLEYELSSTSSVKVSQQATVTNSPVESGKSITDNYYLSNKTISFSGIITNVSVAGQPANRKRDVDRWIYEIEAIRDNPVSANKIVIVHYDTSIVQNCVITSFDVTKTAKEGDSGWRCDLSFQEISISERAKLVVIPTPKAVAKDSVDPKSSTSTSPKKEVPQKLSTTMGADLKDAGVSLLTPSDAYTQTIKGG